MIYLVPFISQKSYQKNNAKLDLIRVQMSYQVANQTYSFPDLIVNLILPNTPPYFLNELKIN